MDKLVFVSDFFADQIQGGAEICDDVLISALKTKGIKIAKFTSKEFSEKHARLYLKAGFHFLISNFTHLSEPVKKLLQVYSGKYCIIEHDHKYITNRDPSSYVDFLAPPQNIINRDFYKAARHVFCQSVKHASVLSKNLKIDNIVNLGCSLWTDEQLNLLEKCSNNTKNGKHFIMGDPNPIKGLIEAKQLCMTRGLIFDMIEKKPYDEFIETLSRYSKFVFLPKTLESFSRVILEARMLDCGLVTNNLNGCTYEPWFKDLKGQKLIDFVRSKRSEIVDIVADKMFEQDQTETRQGDITVILNCYRRPYNLKMQVDALRSQTIEPKQIWLWINYHEDNKDFDPATLGVDRVFSNDHNWKFYGRFAAALLADTEYIAIYDDDTVPGRKWHENCLNTMKIHEGIMGSAGIILNSNRYVQHERCGWPTQNEQITEVDLVGHAWFFKREWLRYLWQEKPTTWDNGEDIQFGYMAKVHGGISTYCPPHPHDDKELHGSVLGNELGIDDKATSTNSAVSHQQFFAERDVCVQAGLKGGWKTVRGVK